MTTDVVITGVGIVNAAFTGASEALGAYLTSPRPAAPSFAAGAPGIALADEALSRLVDATEARRMSRVSQLAVAAARLALADARIAGDTPLGLVIGTEFGDLRSTKAFADGYLQRGPAGLSALLFPNTVMNTMAAATSIAVRSREASVTVNAPLVAGELAVARAAAAVANGRLPVALAGGVDQLDGDIVRMIGRLGGAGETHGEGAAFVVLEPRAAAVARGVPILGRIAGWASRVLTARPYGVGRGTTSAAIATALRDADVAAPDVRWIYRSASGDAARDRWEDEVLGDDLVGRPSATLRRDIGRHSGLGALRVAAAAWTARSGLLPSDGGDVVRVPIGPGLVHGLARGGTHVALVVTS
ncbi:MAG: hypothetical protein HYU41_12150 [Candidatus Rokubacteria bacterium]|nr:hypothetical protein [Candidatus Rokubacteria bacterium]